MNKRSPFWSKVKSLGESYYRMIRPLQKKQFLLIVYFESGDYEKVVLEKMNNAIAIAIKNLSEVGHSKRLVTEVLDHQTECKSGPSQV